MLLNNRSPREADLAPKEINSIKTNKGTNAKGVPDGTKKEKNFILCSVKPIIATPKNIVKLKPKDTIAEADKAKEYGTFPSKFINNININKEYIKGK